MREMASYILFSAKTQIYEQNTNKVELKSLYFNLVYVFLFSAKTRIYQQSIHKIELKTLYFNFVCLLHNRFLLSISRKWKTIEVLSFSHTVSQFIMQVCKPRVAHKLVQLCRKNLERTVLRY